MNFKKISLIGFSLLIFNSPAIQAAAENLPVAAAPKSKAEFCESRKSFDYFTSLAHNSENLLTFRNGGGLLNKGVCWWHNLFQRSALYLAVYRPEQAKPNRAQARKIIHAIASGKRVVEIPGYKNMSEFSRDWRKEIQSKLEAWQRTDGFLKFAWIQGLSGSHETDPKKIAATLGYTITRANERGEINWTMWQIKGITAHASLMVGGEITNTLHQAHHIDSNAPTAVRIMRWQPPARSVEGYMGKFVPYVARRSDLSGFKKAGDRYCSSRVYDGDFPDEPLSNHID